MVKRVSSYDGGVRLPAAATRLAWVSWAMASHPARA
jgi:hypothetical protein